MEKHERFPLSTRELSPEALKEAAAWVDRWNTETRDARQRYGIPMIDLFPQKQEASRITLIARIGDHGPLNELLTGLEEVAGMLETQGLGQEASNLRSLVEKFMMLGGGPEEKA